MCVPSAAQVPTGSSSAARSCAESGNRPILRAWSPSSPNSRAASGRTRSLPLFLEAAVRDLKALGGLADEDRVRGPVRDLRSAELHGLERPYTEAGGAGGPGPVGG